MKVNFKELEKHIPLDTKWATVKQVAEWMALDHATHSNRLGVWLGCLCSQSRYISHRGAKVRAWCFDIEWATPKEWTNAEIRKGLDISEANLSTVRLVRQVVKLG
jgi:hypothetical protein